MLRKTFLEKANRGSKNLQAVLLKNQERSVFWPVTLTLILLLVSVCLGALKFGSLPPQLPLYYSRPWGEAMLAKTPMIFTLPAIILVLIIVDSLLYMRLVKISAYLANILLLTVLVTSILLAWTFVKIILLVS